MPSLREFYLWARHEQNCTDGVSPSGTVVLKSWKVGKLTVLPLPKDLDVPAEFLWAVEAISTLGLDHSFLNNYKRE